MVMDNYLSGHGPKLSRALEARKSNPGTLEPGKSMIVLCIFYEFL